MKELGLTMLREKTEINIDHLCATSLYQRASENKSD
jgi:hypothetical protein